MSYFTWIGSQPEGSVAANVRRRIRSSSVLKASLALATVLSLVSSGAVFAEPPMEGSAPEVSPPAPIWSINIYDGSAVRYQDPDWAACAAAAAQSMLNLVGVTTQADLPPRGGSLPRTTLHWQVDTSFAVEESILAYERQNMTMYQSSPGTDAHGWRNALNYFGWGSMTAGVYVDTSFPSFDAAARQTVRSLAKTGKPVGILGWFGGHAQYITGYTVQGEDPRISDNYTILGVFMTDPLGSDQIRNVYTSMDTWRNGPLYVRFSPYYHNDSPYRDPIDGGTGNSQWWGKWVIINAVK
ncbi:MAG TPA: hypothetical protein VF337_06940 [Candidatus Limnocylindrales bacterium]